MKLWYVVLIPWLFLDRWLGHEVNCFLLPVGVAPTNHDDPVPTTQLLITPDFSQQAQQCKRQDVIILVQPFYPAYQSIFIFTNSAKQTCALQC